MLSKTSIVCRGTFQIEAINNPTAYVPATCLGYISQAARVSSMHILKIDQMDVYLAVSYIDFDKESCMYQLQWYFHFLQTVTQYNNIRLTNTLYQMIL